MIEGFFTKKEVESTSRLGGKTLSCISCGLYKQCTTPKMEPYGNFKKRILNIGEAPGETEDRKGKPWQGKAGKLLQQTYEELGIDLFNDCLNINAVHCRPTDKEGNNRAPSNFEADCCRSKTISIIKEYKPKVIVLLGTTAVYSLIGHRWKKDLSGVSKWRGFTIPDQDYMSWLCPTFHPSYIERSMEAGFTKDPNPPEKLIWKQDLKQAFSLLEKTQYRNEKVLMHPFPIYKEPVIEYIEDLSVLNNITSREIAFDYETTGLKPHAEGHRIICVSVADTEDHAYVFLMPKTRRERKPFVDLLLNPDIGKIAQNMKYEDAWTEVKLGINVQNWVWDTMLATHIIDNRPGVTGLKFQTYVQFGVVDYASEVEPYLSAVDNNNGNSLNRIEDLIKKPGGIKVITKYCGYDSINELRLANKQRIDILPF